MNEITVTDTRARPPMDDELQTTFTNVLIGVDESSAGRDAIALGETLRDPDGETTLAHVVVIPAPVYRNFEATPAGREAHQMLELEAAATGASAGVAGTFAPSVDAGLLQLVADHGADLLVVGRGAPARMLRLLRAARAVPVAVAVAPAGYRKRARRPLHTIGVAYDGSPESELALEEAHRLAARDGAAVELVHFDDQVDLLVVGSRGRGGLRRTLLGSTAAQMVRSATCPVLILPDPG